MLVAFYKGRDRLFNRLVSWKDEGPYSHLEAVFDVTARWLDKPYNRYECASSSFMDGGIRFKEIDLTPEHWDICDVPAFDAVRSRQWFVENEFITLASGEKKRRPYDTRGLVNFVIPVGHSKEGYFCDEAFLASIGMNEPFRFSPNGAACICDLAGGKWIQGGPTWGQRGAAYALPAGARRTAC